MFRRNKKLLDDNVEYVQQMLAMKENRANIINDLTSGKVSKEQLNQRMQLNSEAEEAKLDAIVKPEYLKQNMN